MKKRPRKPLRPEARRMILVPVGGRPPRHGVKMVPLRCQVTPDVLRWLRAHGAGQTVIDLVREKMEDTP